MGEGNERKCNSSRFIRMLSCCCISVPQSIATRLVYCMGFFVIACIAFTISGWPALAAIFQNGTGTLGSEVCNETCHRAIAVFKLSLALALYHTTLMLCTIEIQSSREWRAKIQNSFWIVKTIFLAGLITTTSFIPEDNLVSFPAVSFTFSTLFLLIQAFMLVDFAYKLAGKWISRYEDTGGFIWKALLIVTTLLSILGTLAGCIALYVFYGPIGTNGCTKNPVVVSFLLALSLFHALLSINSRVQERNPRSGLLQSAVISLYTAYLASSAMAGDTICVPAALASSRSSSTSTSSATDEYIKLGGILVSIVALTSSAFDTGSDTSFTSRTLVDPDDADDEQDQLTYNYAFFHFAMTLASFYMAALATGWIPRATDLVSAGTATAAVVAPYWVKIGSAFAIQMLYIWSVMAPCVRSLSFQGVNF